MKKQIVPITYGHYQYDICLGSFTRKFLSFAMYLPGTLKVTEILRKYQQKQREGVTYWIYLQHLYHRKSKGSSLLQGKITVIIHKNHLQAIIEITAKKR